MVPGSWALGFKVNYFLLGFKVHVLYYLIASVIALFGTYF